MKTLKKTLCLVLAMVMVFGLCAISASADLTYTDNDKITYLEAVDVMSGIGILKGDERGFRPTDDINRAEAAKILAYMMIGDSTQADALKAGSDPFTDVPASHWAAGYIAYCANVGVIKGMGDGTYHPGDNVTGLQFATMLLRALGYGQNEEYEGTDWAISASKDALRLGVFEKNPAGASATAKATREECALYAFNVMQGANNYKGIQKVSYSALLGGYITSSTGFGQANAPDANKDTTFGGDYNLKMNKEDGDVFGRMAGHSWAVRTKGNVISGTYYDEADLVGEYYTKVTKGDVAELLGASFIKDVQKESGLYEVWVNGVKDNKVSGNRFIDIEDLTKGNKDNLVDKAGDVFKTETGNGVETLIYAGINEDNESWIRIVVVDTFLAKVTNVAKDDTVTVNLLNDKDNKAYSISFDTDGRKIKAEDFKKDDYVLVNIDMDGGKNNGPAVKAIEKATIVEDTVSRYQKVDTKVTMTAAGTEYVAAKNTAMDADLKAADDKDISQRSIVNGKKHVLYIDKNGYLVSVANIDEASNYVYVSHFGLIDVDGAFDGHAIGAKVYYVDGTSDILTVNTKWSAKKDNKDTASSKPSEIESGFWSGYDDNLFVGCGTSVVQNDPKFNSDYAANIYELATKDGKAVLSNPGTNVGLNSSAAKNQVKKSISTIVVNDTDSDKSLKADGKTVFFYVNMIDPDEWDNKDLTVKAYVGINNVRQSKDKNATVDAYIMEDGSGTMTDAVLVKDDLTGDTDDTVYFFTGNYDDQDGASLTVTYDTYVNGEEYDLIITYDTYKDKDDALDKFVGPKGGAGVTNQFFTLDSKNMPVQSTLVEWVDKSDHDKGTQAKEISKFCYTNDLEIKRADVDTDEFTFIATYGHNSQNDNWYAYDNATVIDVSGAKAKIESYTDLENALQVKADNDAGTKIIYDNSYNGRVVTEIKVAVQYANDASNTVSYIYIVGVNSAKVDESGATSDTQNQFTPTPAT